MGFDVGWSTVRGTLAAVPAETDPDGGNDAYAFSEDGSAATTHYLLKGISSVVGQQYILPVIAKASNRNWIAVGVSGGGDRSHFDLVTPAVGTTIGWL